MGLSQASISLALITIAVSLLRVTDSISANLDFTNPTKNFNLDNNLDYNLKEPSSIEFQYQPRHVHISYGNSPTEIFITWSTLNLPPKSSSVVESCLWNPGQASMFLPTAGSSILFEEQGPMKLKQYIHRVTLKNLMPNTTYVYHCGSVFGWSDLFWFTTMKSGNDWSPKLAVYGDLGAENGQSLDRLQREVQMAEYDAVLHVGGFAYDLDTDDGHVGDLFMDQIEPIAAYIPYMTCPGCHESNLNFSQYKNRFTMPGDYESMMYSWNLGPIHFISFSTEFYYYLQYGLKPLVNQYKWLEADLQEANKAENRAKQPWIITYGHRPMYCSNSGQDDCTRNDTLVRVGLPLTHWFGLEDMFMKYGVDLTIWAHEHSYERLWPLYNHTVYNGSYDEPYRNPKALVHVITGSAGCVTGHDQFHPDQPSWSAFRNSDYGYSRLQVLNATHLYMEQVSDDQDGKVVDSFYLIREQHEAYKIPNSHGLQNQAFLEVKIMLFYVILVPFFV